MKAVKEVIIVEGRYDKNTVSQVVDATILETNGFGIFSDPEKLSMLRQIAEKRGIIVLTDSDAAGFVIRNYLKGAIEPKYIKNAYIPDIPGKERRKSAPSGEGKLGVEGMKRDVIINALKKAGATFSDETVSRSRRRGDIVKADLYALGLSGTENSRCARQALLKKLELPERLSTNSFLDVLNVFMTKDELYKLMESED